MIADLGQTDHFMNVTLQRDGKIVAIGFADGDILVARFNPDGSPDAGFGLGGRGWTTTDFAGRQDIAFDVAIRPTGKIVVGGHRVDSWRVSHLRQGETRQKSMRPDSMPDT